MRRQFSTRKKIEAFIYVEGLLNSSHGGGGEDSITQLATNRYLSHAHSI